MCMYIYSCAHVYNRVSSTTWGVVTLYRRDIEPWRSSSPQIQPEYLKEAGPIYRARDPYTTKVFTRAISI